MNFLNFECSGLESVLNAFGCSRWNRTHSLEKLKAIYMKHFLFYLIIKLQYQFQTSELKNVKKLVEQTVQALKPC